MAIEHASVQVAHKPWGMTDLRPWSSIDGADDDPVGELWFQRVDRTAPSTALLLKLLFTSQPLSIQVHPDDEFARSIGLPNGKTEAWYIISAAPGAQVALGLKLPLTPQRLRAAIRDGSIAGLAQWRPVAKGDVVFVPAGTIHAIGAGIVLAEIQQRSDTTFRLFDHGRSRELHEDDAVAASDAGPCRVQPDSRRVTTARSALVVDPHFVLERIDLQANACCVLDTDRETWILVIEGSGRIGLTNAAVGDAIYIDADSAGIEVGPDGITCLVAYPGPGPIVSLLNERIGRMPQPAGTSAVRVPKPSNSIEAQT
jgi:mannose-6-phosphate isomerase